MISSKPLRITVRLFIILLWAAVALCDVIIIDDYVRGFAIMIGSAWLLFRIERHLCAGVDAAPASRLPKEPAGKFWLQHADGGCITITDETAAGISNALTHFNWEAEVAKYKAMKGKGVPPGIGLGNFGDAHFVHITSTTATDCDVLYARGPKAENQIFRKSQSFRTIGKAVAFYMLGEEKKLLELLEQT